MNYYFNAFVDAITYAIPAIVVILTVYPVI